MTDDEYMTAAVAHINNECGGRFTVPPVPPATTPKVTLPADVQFGATLLVKAMKENPAVSSQSLGDMSKSFFQGGTYKAAQKYWAAYRKAKFV